ncbi:branched-chain alpha-ketoacid dehydrogenase [Gongronella butleri]|nr:branched-chain alpha-ketoacid dehydrogenase [Gongronella butleri]
MRRIKRLFSHVSKGVNSTSVLEPQFYANQTVQEYVQISPTPITLRQLLFYERHRTKERLIKSANFVRRELPIRIAHRLWDMQQLPFIVGSNPHLLAVYNLYWEAFERLRHCKPIETVDDNAQFCKVLQQSLVDHLVVIPHLALGIQECQDYLDKEKRDAFMNALLKSRISRRVLAEQHLILSEYPPVVTSAYDHGLPESGRTMVFQNCSAQDILQKCTTRLAELYPHVPVTIQQHGNVKFAYVVDHIEYILFQILQNASQHTNKIHPSTSAPVDVMVCANDTDVFFRISDQAGGIDPDTYRQLWSFGLHGNFKHVTTWTGTMNEQPNNGAMPMGMGLPMSKVYAEYWGGDISVMTLNGYGTDAYVRIPKQGDQLEHLDEEFDASDLRGEVDSGSDPTHRRKFVI